MQSGALVADFLRPTTKPLVALARRLSCPEGTLLLSAALSQLACDGWTWLDEGPRPPADGSPLVVKVLGTRQCTPAPGHPEEARRLEGTTLLGVEVELTGWDPAGVPANFYYAHLEDTEGRRYEGQDGCDPLLAGPPLERAQRTQGYVSFAAPPAPLGEYKFVYAPRLGSTSTGGDPARFEVPLGARD